MQITAEFQKIMISFYKNSLVSALIEMTASVMPAVIVNCIGGVKALHETLEICFRGHNVFSFIAPACYMIPGTRIFYAKWPNHKSANTTTIYPCQ